MPIIDSKSYAKFDALVRTNKDDTLMAFIKASYNIKEKDNRKKLISDKLIKTYELFKGKGPGSYGNGSRDIMSQFESHYTMGLEMGIWIDSELNLSDLAVKVANYSITVKEYIGIVFRNLFSYYEIDGEMKYHHFLFEVLNVIKNSDLNYNEIPKNVIKETLPIGEKQNEQGNLLFNYLVASDIFTKISGDYFKLNDEWQSSLDELIQSCNLEYKYLSREDALEMAKDKEKYSNYISKINIKENDTNNLKLLDKNRYVGGKNILLYGVPGSGKSHTINTQYCNDETKIERVVFHPDYMSTDFIGQILPTIKDDGMITYEFTSGPFTKILKRAYEDPSNMYYLIIEEINRGNAPAIFGEVFQLLDRNKDGNSTYGITNENVAKIVYGNANRLISLPSNLWILATMNTADQNVFTLDTAFQRRWIMRMIKNDIEGAKHADTEILDTGVTWKMFAETINNQIIQSNSATMSSEDKRLGAYFITDDILFEDKENMQKENFNCLFAEKVIKYLWDDAFKFGRDKLFNPEYKTLERIIEEFSNIEGFKRFDIFETSIKDILKNKSETYKEQDVFEEDEDSKNIVEE